MLFERLESHQQATVLFHSIALTSWQRKCRQTRFGRTSGLDGNTLADLPVPSVKTDAPFEQRGSKQTQHSPWPAAIAKSIVVITELGWGNWWVGVIVQPRGLGEVNSTGDDKKRAILGKIFKMRKKIILTSAALETRGSSIIRSGGSQGLTGRFQAFSCLSCVVFILWFMSMPCRAWCVVWFESQSHYFHC